MAASNFTWDDWDWEENDLQSESIKVIQWHGFFSILLIIVCSALAIISTASKSLIIYYVLYKAPKRPMNTMILFDQIGTLITGLVTNFMTISSLVLATSILDFYGPLACDMYFLIAITHNILMVTGGLAMALFRMICVQFQGYVSSMEKLMIRLMCMQYILAACMLMWTWTGVDTYGSSPAYEFGRGYTTKMAHTLMRQTKERMVWGGKVSVGSILFAKILIILEFVCYIVNYWSLREKNKDLINIVQEDVLKKRAQKNTITLTGQAVTFVVEMTVAILVNVLVHYGTLGGFFEPGAFPCALLVGMAAVTSSQILASPELRRFIQGYD